MPDDAIREALATFAGVPHRLEEVATHDGVLFVNDSKATNADSTIMALRSFPSGVRLILGGRGKGQDFAPLRDATGACRSIHLIGEDAERIGAEIAAGFPDLTLRTEPAHQEAFVRQETPGRWAAGSQVEVAVGTLYAWTVERKRRPSGSVRSVLVPAAGAEGTGPYVEFALSLS